jgi:hypothetical protein
VEHISICVYADSDLRVKNMNTINKNLLDSSIEGGVKVNELVNMYEDSNHLGCATVHWVSISRLCKGF